MACVVSCLESSSITQIQNYQVFQTFNCTCIYYNPGHSQNRLYICVDVKSFQLLQTTEDGCITSSFTRCIVSVERLGFGLNAKTQ